MGGDPVLDYTRAKDQSDSVQNRTPDAPYFILASSRITKRSPLQSSMALPTKKRFACTIASAFPEVRLSRWARGRSIFTRATRTPGTASNTYQPEYIGQAISSGCIHMTNEDIIDLVNRVKLSAIVVLPPGRSAWMGPCWFP